MLQFNFDAPALQQITVLDFTSTPKRVTFIGATSVRGEGRQLS
jgi:hypothetical protein